MEFNSKAKSRKLNEKIKTPYRQLIKHSKQLRPKEYTENNDQENKK